MPALQKLVVVKSSFLRMMAMKRIREFCLMERRLYFPWPSELDLASHR